MNAGNGLDPVKNRLLEFVSHASVLTFWKSWWGGGGEVPFAVFQFEFLQSDSFLSRLRQLSHVDSASHCTGCSRVGGWEGGCGCVGLVTGRCADSTQLSTRPARP